MKMEFVDEAELQKAADEPEDEVRGRIVLVGEPMGLFIAEELGELEDVTHFSAAVSGAEYNVAMGLSRLDHEALYCTRLGDDPVGKRILKSMKGNHVSDALVTVTDTASTGFMMKGRTEAGDPKIAYFRRNSAASQISTHDIDKLDLYGCDFLHVTGIFPAVSKSALDAVKRLMSRAKALDMFISFDPNLRPQLWKDEKEMVRTLNSLAQEADLVLPGLSEGKILTKRDTPEGIAEFYHERGVDSVIVKLGDKGAYWSTGGEHGTVPAFPVKRIVDTVGAGDGFAAGVISAVAEGMSLQEAAARGTVIGSIQITHRGDNEGLPTRAELETITKAGIV